MDKYNLDEYEKYLDEVRDILILADSIRESKYHKKVLNHLRVLKQRGIIKDSPMKSNQYRIIRKEKQNGITKSSKSNL